ncbi:MAG: ABC transporter substrate-binding protein, partial [Acidimicrobiia bacterium]
MITVALGLGLAACSNSDQSGPEAAAPDDGGNQPVEQPGVTDTEIRVGGVASRTNDLGTDYGAIFDGANAYFEMLNSEGGIYGRDIELVSERDDMQSNNQAEVQGLLAQDDLFAVLPVGTLLFSGAPLLTEAGVPTFGWNVNPEWNDGENLFGNVGYICFDCPSVKLPWIAKTLDAERIGVLAYAIPQSSDCAESFAQSLVRYPTAELVVDDRSLPFGVTDLSADVARMKDADVDLVATCMDQNATLTLAQEMRRQNLDAVQYLSNAYDHEFIAEYGELFEGSLVTTPFAPFETEN